MCIVILLWFCDWVIGFFWSFMIVKNFLEKYIYVCIYKILNVVLGEVCG